MATSNLCDTETLVERLSANDWATVLEAVGGAERTIRGMVVGDTQALLVVAKLVDLASHPKWEVRRAVANAAAHLHHPAFEGVLAKLAHDDNSRVQLAAEQSALRRRDSRNSSSLGKQHKDRINLMLDDIDARFGSKARDSVRRTADEIANIFTRELYHEVVKLLSPLSVSAQKLQEQLLDANIPPATLVEEAVRMDRRILQLKKILLAMRAYTAQPTIAFKPEGLRDVVQEAATIATESDTTGSARPAIEIDVASTLVIDLSRVRVVQALTNVLLNAIEAYSGMAASEPIRVSARLDQGLVEITVKDSGSGMSQEAQRDALTLFSTSKPNGTGFGLPLAVKIIESEHGGRLTLESKKGHGTAVQMIMPARSQVDAR